MSTRNDVLRSMDVWLQFGSSETTAGRTAEQKAWDSAILAAAEYARRLRREGVAFDSGHLLDLLTPCGDDKRFVTIEQEVQR